MESFFSSLKTERTARRMYRTRDEARADVFDYIGPHSVRRILPDLIHGNLRGKTLLSLRKMSERL